MGGHHFWLLDLGGGYFKPLLDLGSGFTSENTARRFQKRNGRYLEKTFRKCSGYKFIAAMYV
jgi:hypothetical protein